MGEADTTPFADLPGDLRARLVAAGATDAESLRAALAHDADLAVSWQGFVLDQLVEGFLRVTDSDGMAAFWQEVPGELEQPFLETVRAQIAHAHQGGDQSRATALQPRLAGLEALLAQSQQPPYVEALMAFLQATTDDQARAIFDARRDLLQPSQAQQTLDEQFRSDDPATRQRMSQRSLLLRELRGASGGGFDDVRAAPGAGPQPTWLIAEDPQMTALLARFDPLLRSIAAVVRGDDQMRQEIEALLPQLEANNWRLSAAVQAIWAGVRDAPTLTAGIDANSAALVRQILRLIAEPDLWPPVEPSAAPDPDQPTHLTELQQRLAAAGVTDQDSLAAALERDPELSQLFLRYQLDQWLEAFLQAGDADVLGAFWQGVPSELEQAFIEHARATMIEAEAQGESDLAAALRQRVRVLEVWLADGSEAENHDD